jgi:hypothetical protein
MPISSDATTPVRDADAVGRDDARSRCRYRRARRRPFAMPISSDATTPVRDADGVGIATTPGRPAVTNIS